MESDFSFQYLNNHSCIVTIGHLTFSVNCVCDQVDFIVITDFKYIHLSTVVPIFMEDACFEYGKIMMSELGVVIDGDYRRIKCFEEFKFDDLTLTAIPSQLHYSSCGFSLTYGSFSFVIIAPGVAHSTVEMPYINDLNALIVLDPSPQSNNFVTKLKNLQLVIQDAVNNTIPVILTCTADGGYFFNLLLLLRNVQYNTPTKVYLLLNTGIKAYTLINSIPESLCEELRNKAYLGSSSCDLIFETFKDSYDKEFQDRWLSDPGVVLTCSNYATHSLFDSFHVLNSVKNKKGLVFNINQSNINFSTPTDSIDGGLTTLDARMTIQQALTHFKASLSFCPTLDLPENDLLMLNTLYPTLEFCNTNEDIDIAIPDLFMERLALSKQIEKCKFAKVWHQNTLYEFAHFQGELFNDMISIFPIDNVTLYTKVTGSQLLQICKSIFKTDSIELNQNESIQQVFVGDYLAIHLHSHKILIESDDLDKIKLLSDYLIENELLKL